MYEKRAKYGWNICDPWCLAVMVCRFCQLCRKEIEMESLALTTIENGDAIVVLFVIFLLGFGWC